MRPIDKFILHVAHNWRNKLNEAYGKAQLQKFIDHFKEDADELNIQVSDEQIKKYIEVFDKLRQRGGKFSIDPMTLTLPQLIKLVTSVASDIDVDEEDQTPDVVYHEGPITIWNGNKDENCVTYGNGGSWCIARGQWARHRYDQHYSFPTFYIAKNTLLPDSDLTSWIVIAVREDGQYVLHNRENKPYYPVPESFSRLLSQVPWLADIPNIKGLLKYIPLTAKEKIVQIYGKTSNRINIREWISSTFNFKIQYLVIKGQNNINKEDIDFFSDISNDNFVKKVLPKYPRIADFISGSEGVLNPIILLRNLDNFTPQQRKSITANLHIPVGIQYLRGEYLPFDVKILLTKLNKWDSGISKRLYVTDDNSTIVEFALSDNTKINLHQEEDDFDNIKITPRTVKYVTQYPDLEKLSLNFLIKLAETGLISQDLVRSIIDKAKESDGGAMVVKETNGIEILLDSNTLSSYKIEDGKITKIPFSDELVQQAFAEESKNENFQEAGIKVFSTFIVPNNIDKDALFSIVSSTPPEKRIVNGNLVLTSNDPKHPFGMIKLETDYGKNRIFGFYTSDDIDWRKIDGSLTEVTDIDTLKDFYRSYFRYLVVRNVAFTGDEIINQIKGPFGGRPLAIKAFVEANPPISSDSQLVPVIYGGNVTFIDRNNTRVARQYNSYSRRFKNVNISPAEVRRLLRGNEETGGETPTATPTTAPTIHGEPGERRRGRPAGVPNAPRTDVPTAITGGGDINVSQAINGIGLSDAFSNMNRRDRQRLNVTDAVHENLNGDRGAARRNNQLGASGRVTSVISVGPSKIYFITLQSGGIVASINMQPGNRNYLLLQNGTVVTMDSPSELMSALQQRQLAEVRHYMVHDYLHHNPHHLDEVRELLRQHEAKRK
jgi:hypothetical protein